MSEKKTTDLAGAVAAVGGSVAVSAASGDEATTTLAKAIAVLMPRIVTMAIPALYERKKKAGATWWRWVVQEFGETPQRVQDTIESRLLVEGTAETVVAAYDAVLAAISPAVVPTLGAIAAEYLKGGRPADQFFHGSSNLLRGLSASDFGAVRGLLQAVRDVQWSARYWQLISIYQRDNSTIALERPRDDGGTLTLVTLANERIAPVLGGLARSGLAESTAMDCVSGRRQVTIDAHLLRRLASLVRVDDGPNAE